jgi:hypothetical protein
MKDFSMKIKATVLLLGLSFNSFAVNCDNTINDIKVIAWAFEAMLVLNSYNFVNYNRENASNYFTKPAWDAYSKAYADSGIKDQVINKQLVMSVGLFRSPLLLEKGDDKWKVQMSLLNISQSGSEYQEQKNQVILTIIKDPAAADCLKIDSMESTSVPEKQN